MHHWSSYKVKNEATSGMGIGILDAHTKQGTNVGLPTLETIVVNLY